MFARLWLIRLMAPAVVAGLSFFICASPLSAGMLATTEYAYDDDVPPELTALGSTRWQASVVMQKNVYGFNYYNATAEFAVFAPGDFQDFLDEEEIAYSDPSGGSEFVYAYQFVQVLSAQPGLDEFTVGIGLTDPRANQATIDGTGSVTPLSMTDQGTSMLWDFNGTLGAGGTSDILLFTSSYAPEISSMDVNAGVASTGGVITASPGYMLIVPEPASLVMLLGGIGLLLGGYRRG